MSNSNIGTSVGTLELLIRDVYSALLDYNVATLELLLSRELEVHVLGAGIWSGRYVGRGRVLDLWLEVTQRRLGKLDLRLEGVVAEQPARAIVAAVGATPAGPVFSARLFCTIRDEGGRIAEVWLRSQHEETSHSCD